MFGGNKDKSQRPALNVDTLIGARTTIVGNLSFAGGMHIDGKVVGTIKAEAGQDALLVLSDKGVIEGEVHAPHVILNGRMVGDVIASERLELAANARIEGNIFYKVLEMAAGAEVNGRILRNEAPNQTLLDEARANVGKVEISNQTVSSLDVKVTEKKNGEAKRA